MAADRRGQRLERRLGRLAARIGRTLDVVEHPCITVEGGKADSRRIVSLVGDVIGAARETVDRRNRLAQRRRAHP